MISLFKQNKWFYWPYAIIFMLCLYIVVLYSKASIHIYLNKFHTPFFDTFFFYATNLGNGIVLPLFIFPLLFIKFRHVFLFIIVFLVSGLIVQLLKRFVFNDIVRPAEFFKGVYDLYLVPGVKQDYYHSFPSGHSATAFGYMLCIAYIFKKQGLKFLMLIFACIIAYSRVYLSQHFLIDIITGSLIGVLVATFLSLYIDTLKVKWFEMNIISVFKKQP